MLLLIQVFLILFSAFLWAQEPELVAHYPFRRNANDASGNGHHGTVYGATLTADRFGNSNYAYEFDGVDDHIDVPYDSSFYPPSFCATVWVKVNSLPPDTGKTYILTTSGDKNTPPYDPFRLRLDNMGRIYARFEGDTDSVHIRLFSDTYLNFGEWYFIAAYYDSDSSKGALYINGVIEDLSDRSMVLDTNKVGFMIGAGQLHNGNLSDNEFFDGCIDDIRIYNRALSGEEILQLYNEVVGIRPERPFPVDGFVLHQNYPNPFNPGTTIRYRLPRTARVTLNIYNSSGQKIYTLVNAKQAPGEYSVIWNGFDSFEKEAASGVYIYQLQAGEFAENRKMVLLR
jgi:hypothetical protein